MMGPKSGFDPEMMMFPEESAMIQAPPDLLSLLLPSLAIIMPLCVWIISRRLGPRSSSLKFWIRVLDQFGRRLICFDNVDGGEDMQAVTLNLRRGLNLFSSIRTGIPSSCNSSIFVCESMFNFMDS